MCWSLFLIKLQVGVFKNAYFEKYLQATARECLQNLMMWYVFNNKLKLIIGTHETVRRTKKLKFPIKYWVRDLEVIYL